MDQDICPEDGAALCEPEDLARIGTCFANYELTDVIGVGGMGVVYKGVHSALKKTFAIKVLNEYYGKRKSAYQEMLREAQAAGRIRHPHIVNVTDFGTTEEGAAYLVMEYLEGVPLSAVLQHEVRLPVSNAVAIIRQVAAALDAAHQEGIIHRDLKPENVFLVRQRREPGRRSQEISPGERTPLSVKLLDFGLAKVQDMAPSTRTRAGLIAGTPYYMSPEQVRNLPVDPRSDIYSLGVLFYHMVTGVMPFTGTSNIEIMMAHVSVPVTPPRKRYARVDGVTNEVILRCMAKAPEERYQDIEELYDDLARCGGGQVSPLSSGEVAIPSLPVVPPLEHNNLTVSAELVGRVLGATPSAVMEGMGGAGGPLLGSKTQPPQEPLDPPDHVVVAGPTVSSEFIDRVLDQTPPPVMVPLPEPIASGGAAHDEASGEIPEPSVEQLASGTSSSEASSVLVVSEELDELVEDEEDSTDPVMRRLPAAPPAPKARGGIWVVLAGALVLGGGAVFYALQPQEPAANGAVSVSPMPEHRPEERPPEKIRVTLDGLPAGAEVWLDGKKVQPPLSLERSERQHLLRVTATGFAPEEKRFRATANLQFVFNLQALATKSTVVASSKKKALAAKRPRPRRAPKVTKRQAKALSVGKSKKPQPEKTQPKKPQPEKMQPKKPQPDKAQPKKPQPEKTQPKKPAPTKTKKGYNDWVVDPFAAGKKK